MSAAEERAAVVAFLDFDGVIASPRAHVAQHDQPERDTRWLDPIACKLVARLVGEHELTLVISSTWRSFGRERIARCLAPYGLDGALHNDWKTNEWPDGSRPAEIDDWLERNAHPPFIILDDDGFAWTGQQRAVWVQSCSYNAFNLSNFEQAKKLLAAIQRGEHREEG
jgi:hypothetical protein